MIKVGDKVKIIDVNNSLKYVKDAIDIEKNYDVVDVINEYTLVIEVHDKDHTWMIPYHFLININEIEKVEEE